MTDVARQKFAALMAEIEDLENRVADLETEAEELKGTDEGKVADEELRNLREQMAAKRNELARISDGCGKPHPR